MGKRQKGNIRSFRCGNFQDHKKIAAIAHTATLWAENPAEEAFLPEDQQSPKLSITSKQNEKGELDTRIIVHKSMLTEKPENKRHFKIKNSSQKLTDERLIWLKKNLGLTHEDVQKYWEIRQDLDMKIRQKLFTYLIEEGLSKNALCRLFMPDIPLSTAKGRINKEFKILELVSPTFKQKKTYKELNKLIDQWAKELEELQLTPEQILNYWHEDLPKNIKLRLYEFLYSKNLNNNDLARLFYGTDNPTKTQNNKVRQEYLRIRTKKSPRKHLKNSVDEILTLKRLEWINKNLELTLEQIRDYWQIKEELPTNTRRELYNYLFKVGLNISDLAKIFLSGIPLSTARHRIFADCRLLGLKVLSPLSEKKKSIEELLLPRRTKWLENNLGLTIDQLQNYWMIRDGISLEKKRCLYRFLSSRGLSIGDVAFIFSRNSKINENAAARRIRTEMKKLGIKKMTKEELLNSLTNEVQEIIKNNTSNSEFIQLSSIIKMIEDSGKPLKQFPLILINLIDRENFKILPSEINNFGEVGVIRRGEILFILYWMYELPSSQIARILNEALSERVYNHSKIHSLIRRRFPCRSSPQIPKKELKEIEQGKNIIEIARKYKISPQTVAKQAKLNGINTAIDKISIVEVEELRDIFSIENDVLPHEVTLGSQIKRKWNCYCEKSYEMSPRNLTYSGRKYHYCQECMAEKFGICSSTWLIWEEMAKEITLEEYPSAKLGWDNYYLGMFKGKLRRKIPDSTFDINANGERRKVYDQLKRSFNAQDATRLINKFDRLEKIRICRDMKTNGQDKHILETIEKYNDNFDIIQIFCLENTGKPFLHEVKNPITGKLSKIIPVTFFDPNDVSRMLENEVTATEYEKKILTLLDTIKKVELKSAPKSIIET
ncbi:MAG: zinc-ribbon domain-containing protein [Promethearchaeota archaeon]